MSGTEQTFHTTKEDIRKLAARESDRHPDGNIPKDSEAAALQVRPTLTKNSSCSHLEC